MISRSTTRAPEGTGLGLSLCKSIVEEHGGELALRSARGEGTTFVARLPLDTDSAMGMLA